MVSLRDVTRKLWAVVVHCLQESQYRTPRTNKLNIYKILIECRQVWSFRSEAASLSLRCCGHRQGDKRGEFTLHNALAGLIWGVVMILTWVVVG